MRAVVTRRAVLLQTDGVLGHENVNQRQENGDTAFFGSVDKVVEPGNRLGMGIVFARVHAV